MDAPHRRSPRTTIKTLNVDVLLEVFDWYRLYSTTDESDLGWSIERWWYKPIHVCRKWRHLILASSTRLDLHLVCTYDIPVEAMILHSPYLPLIIYYPGTPGEMSIADEESALFALQQRERVRRIHVVAPTVILCKLFKDMDGEFPILERLVLRSQTESRIGLVLPEKLRAPLLHHLTLSNITLPIGSQLLRHAKGLITLALLNIPTTSKYHLEHLVAHLSDMSHLEIVTIHFYNKVKQRLERVQAKQIVLSRLKLLVLRGGSTYLEAIQSRLSTPLLSTLSVEFLNQLTFEIHRLLLLVRMTGGPRFRSARMRFEQDFVSVIVDPFLEHKGSYPFLVRVSCQPLHWQATGAAQICATLAPLLARVDGLTLEFHNDGPESWEDESDRHPWHRILKTFANVKSLQLTGSLAVDFFYFVIFSEGRMSLRLLPGLKELVTSGRGHTGDVFASFASARQSAGRPIRLVRN